MELSFLYCWMDLVDILHMITASITCTMIYVASLLAVSTNDLSASSFMFPYFLAVWFVFYPRLLELYGSVYMIFNYFLQEV